jgi:hypothetical protein
MSKLNNKQQQVLNTLKSIFDESEQSIMNLQEKLAKVQLERDILQEKFEHSKSSNHIAYTVIYSKDNGEGVDTETCIGVFTTKALAMQTILNICNENKDLSIHAFTIEEFPVDEPLQPDVRVQVVQYDEEAHCEVSTSILGIQCKSLQQKNITDSYLTEYKVNTVYFID